MDEQSAIRQLKNGDLHGLETLVRLHQVRAIRTAFLITHDTQTAEDVVQDLFLNLPRAIQNFHEGRPFEPWFMRSVVRAAVKAVRKDARSRALDDAEDSGWLLRWQQLDGMNVETQVEQAQFEAGVQQALRQLSPRQRAVIVQRYYLGMNEKEMVNDLQIAPGTVKWLLNAARCRLKELLERSAR